ncbi:MAG: Hydrogenase isoenzymes formation protein HypE [Verrucomicrobia bacterium ADurb.Bin345]|nr:MAG: Hydrogenase isoenzymes formation protein HypE [Verrucomicrobia bacterium ADurb.Bin345]
MANLGKITDDFFQRVIKPQLGAKRPEVAVGPEQGVDVGIIELGEHALAMTADPVFIVPEYGFERSAWFAIHILASDAVTSGLAPAFLSIDLNLPPGLADADLEAMWGVIHRECERMGAAIVTGHTGRYDNCQYPMVGGATFMAMGPRDAYCSPRFCKPGDRIIITKGPAVEATGIFAAMFPDRIERRFGPGVRKQAEDVFFKMSVVEDARLCASIGTRDGGVAAMHDATEYGIWGGLHEFAKAAGLGLVVHCDEIVWTPGVKEVCEEFGIEPFSSISEGTLIAAVRPHAAAEALRRLADAGIAASICGEMTEAAAGIRVVEGARERELQHPGVDPFWAAFYNALR